jgi:hypothetical protein
MMTGTPTYTTEQRIAVLRASWSDRGIVEQVANFARTLADVVNDQARPDDVRQRAVRRLRAAWLAINGMGSGKTAKRMLLAAAVRTAASPDMDLQMPERIEIALMLYGGFFDDAADLTPKRLRRAIQSWNGRKGRRAKSAEVPAGRWIAFADLCEDIDCPVSDATAERQWKKHQRTLAP